MNEWMKGRDLCLHMFISLKWMNIDGTAMEGILITSWEDHMTLEDINGRWR